MSRTAPFTEVSRLMLSGGAALSRSLVESLIHRHERHAAIRLALLWSYFRNTMSASSPSCDTGRQYRLAQERGLPPRVLGTWDKRSRAARFVADDRSLGRKEIVVENDIAWRIQTMVDFMFGRPITIASTASDPHLKHTIERVLAAIWESSGGIALLQDIGLMGHVYGHVDLLVRAAETDQQTHDQTQEPTPRGDAHTGGASGELASILDRALGKVRIELIEPPRGVALSSASDYRKLDAYIIRSRRESRDPAAQSDSNRIASSLLRWWKPATEDRSGPNSSAIITTTEIFAGGARQTYEQAEGAAPRLIDEGPSLVIENVGDTPPIVHIQNIAQPFEYEGIGEVEPLIPLQDELNTRLSDRASRVTLQSFKKHL